MTMRMHFVLMAVMALIMRVTALQGKIGCDDHLTVYVNGSEVASDTVWNRVNDISLADTPTVIAAKCVNTGGGGGLVGSFDDGVVTDTSWLCSGTESPGWTEASFNDSDWASAVLTDNAPGLGNYGGVSASAKFIWSDTQSTGTTFCRMYLEPDEGEVTPNGCVYNGVFHPASSTWIQDIHSDPVRQMECTCPEPLPETWSAKTGGCRAACLYFDTVVHYGGDDYQVDRGPILDCSCSSFGRERCVERL